MLLHCVDDFYYFLARIYIVIIRIMSVNTILYLHIYSAAIWRSAASVITTPKDKIRYALRNILTVITMICG